MKQKTAVRCPTLGPSVAQRTSRSSDSLSPRMDGLKEEFEATSESHSFHKQYKLVPSIEGVRTEDSVQQFNISYESKEVIDQGGVHIFAIETAHTAVSIQGNMQPALSSELVSNGESSAKEPLVSHDLPDIVIEKAENGHPMKVDRNMDHDGCGSEVPDNSARTVLAADDKIEVGPAVVVDIILKSLPAARNSSSPMSISNEDKKYQDIIKEQCSIDEKLDVGGPESCHISICAAAVESSSKSSSFNTKDELLFESEEIPKAQEPSQTIGDVGGAEATVGSSDVQMIVEELHTATEGVNPLVQNIEPEQKLAEEAVLQNELQPSVRSQDVELFSMEELVRGGIVEEGTTKHIDTGKTIDVKILEDHMDMTVDIPGVGELVSKRQPETEMSGQDVQEIKGCKVWKRFGRKKYLGDVVDYDAENKWFKVIYEDGDQEDLDLGEIREILLPPGTLPKSVVKKMIHPVKEKADQQRKMKRKRGRPPKKSQAAAGTSSEKKKPERMKRPYERRTEPTESKDKSSTTQSTMTGNETSDTSDLMDLVTKHESAFQEKSPSKRGRKKKMQSDTELSTGSKRGKNVGTKTRGKKRKIQYNAETSTNTKPVVMENEKMCTATVRAETLHENNSDLKEDAPTVDHKSEQSEAVIVYQTTQQEGASQSDRNHLGIEQNVELQEKLVTDVVKDERMHIAEVRAETLLENISQLKDDGTTVDHKSEQSETVTVCHNTIQLECASSSKSKQLGTEQNVKLQEKMQITEERDQPGMDTPEEHCAVIGKKIKKRFKGVLCTGIVIGLNEVKHIIR